MDEGLPPRIPFLPDLVIHHPDGVVITGMDGEVVWLDTNLQPLGSPSQPHPMRIHRAVVENDLLIGMWLDRELLLACMAALPVGSSENGRTRAEVRASMGTRTTHQPAGHVWTHSLDAEPMVLASNGEVLVFELYRRGLYSTKTNAEERWRQPPPSWNYSKRRPRNEETVGLQIKGEEVFMTSKGGRVQRRALDTGALLEEYILPGIEGPIERHFTSGHHDLMCSSHGTVSWLTGQKLVAQAQLSGPVQHAAWDAQMKGWRIAGWREEAVLAPDTVQREATSEIPVHVYPHRSGALLLMNDGTWQSSAIESRHGVTEEE
ncbi:MAG: hypothetical protein ISP84_04360 [Candidatus Poseidonia sp.]|nr:hypothetical protein [Poseidonia sp.]